MRIVSSVVAAALLCALPAGAEDEGAASANLSAAMCRYAGAQRAPGSMKQMCELLASECPARSSSSFACMLYENLLPMPAPSGFVAALLAGHLVGHVPEPAELPPCAENGFEAQLQCEADRQTRMLQQVEQIRTRSATLAGAAEVWCDGPTGDLAEACAAARRPPTAAERTVQRAFLWSDTDAYASIRGSLPPPRSAPTTTSTSSAGAPAVVAEEPLEPETVLLTLGVVAGAAVVVGGAIWLLSPSKETRAVVVFPAP